MLPVRTLRKNRQRETCHPPRLPTLALRQTCVASLPSQLATRRAALVLRRAAPPACRRPGPARSPARILGEGRRRGGRARTRRGGGARRPRRPALRPGPRLRRVAGRGLLPRRLPPHAGGAAPPGGPAPERRGAAPLARRRVPRLPLGG